MSEVTHLLEAAQRGDRLAAEQLLPLVYDELRKLAAVRMASEAAGHTLDATALVHEAYLRLVGDQWFDGRGHFFAAAAEAMRRILVDAARQRLAGKRGGGRKGIPLEESHRITESPEGLIALHEALEVLARESPKRAKLVELRFFAGLTISEAAKSLNISEATAERWWTYARAWLYEKLDPENPENR
jgi:RNA polymerase sigma factor (TIGR02999 family)